MYRNKAGQMGNGFLYSSSHRFLELGSMERVFMNTIREEFKEEQLTDVQRWWIRRPITVMLFILLVIVVGGVALFDGLVEWLHEIKSQWSYAKQCWRGKRD